MRLHRRGSWTETRRELAQLIWAIALIDVISIGLGALASRAMGAFALKVGVGLAAFATVAFVALVLGNLGAEFLAHRWLDRDRRRPRSR